MRRQAASGISQKNEAGIIINRAKEEQDFLVLLCYIRRSPKIVQEVFVPYVQALTEQYLQSPIIGELVEKLNYKVKGRNKLDR